MSDLDNIRNHISSLHDSIQELNRKSINLRESFITTHHELDNAVNTLSSNKKLFKECNNDIKNQKKIGNNTTKLEELSNNIQPLIQDLNQRLVPGTGSLFVRLLLGRVNVKVYKDGERIRLKSEYEKFRSRTNPFIIIAGIIQLIFPNLYLFHAIFQIWLLYYYVTLALREHILKVNGSNINRWWIFHHYLAILTSVIILTWNFGNSGYMFFYPIMMVYTICQGSVQILMNRYQIGRLYNLVARGEASRMDVTAETIDPRFVPSMTFLMPFLILIQLFQGYCGLILFHFYYYNQDCSWHTLGIGLLFLILSIGNLWTTLGTFIRKRFQQSKQVVQKASKRILGKEDEK